MPLHLLVFSLLQQVFEIYTILRQRLVVLLAYLLLLASQFLCAFSPH